MRSNILLALLALLALAAALPFKEKVALHNSLQVGREENPNVWGCTGCTQETKPNHSHVIQENSKDVKAILSVYDDYTVLAFRYTATIKNVWSDILWAIQTRDEHAPEGCKVQKEFDSMWNLVRNDTYDDLAESSHTGRLIITGISLGGGLASLSYVDISHGEIFDNVEVITFGSPRVGNRKWAAWYDSISQTPTQHICLKGDPICIMPRCITPICNYKHPGFSVKCNPTKGECVRGQEVTMTEFEDFEGLVNGGIEHVYEQLAQESDDENQLEGILTHINGYKKMTDYSFVTK